MSDIMHVWRDEGPEFGGVRPLCGGVEHNYGPMPSLEQARGIVVNVLKEEPMSERPLSCEKCWSKVEYIVRLEREAMVNE